MRPQWTIRGVARGMALILAITIVPALALPGAAGAIEPSVPLPEIKPVAVQPEPIKLRGDDNATKNAISGNQLPRNVDPGSNTPSATSLSPSASWDVGLHTGDFTWSYPLRVPPAPGGLAPNLALSYRSSAVDGRTSVTNNQPSWVGDGWDLWPGFVERTYGSCIDDDVPNKGDLCWRSDNATAAYGGSGGMLICCDGQGKWRAKNDDGSRIERLTGAPNGDKGTDHRDSGEHWKITTVDGTQYFFGSQADAQSTWTVPVFGDDAGEPCHGTTFDTSHCAQAWRWNLDKVVDRNGNVIRYFYEAERNKYGLNVKDTAVEYIRGGVLKRIDYGSHESVAGRATGQVEFGTANRCLPGSDCRLESKGNWPDTPLDEKCDTTTCKGHYSPSFWSTQRLSTVTTKVLKGSTYEPVDQWTLEQSFPDPGDNNKAALWLRSIRHTGLAGDGKDVELPAVTFEGTQYPNRVYRIDDGYAPLVRYRVTGVISESGGVISVTYASQCTADDPHVDAKDNTRWCFPVTWAPPGHAQRTDRFHKYVVASVSLSDTVSSSTDHVTRYEYLDGAAWHWDTSEFVKENKKNWNEFRGFSRVRVRTGLPTDPGGSPISLSEHRFYRGMHGDKWPARVGEWPPTGSRPPQTVSDSLGEAGKSVREDSDWLQGFGFETTAYDHAPPAGQPDPPVVSRTVSYPDSQGPTATRGEFKSYIVRAGTERGRIVLKSGGWRETKTVTRYDDRGLLTSVDDFGDATTADDRCTTMKYARDPENVNKWLLNLPLTGRTVSVNCATTPRLPDHAISATQSSYDGRGNLAKAEIAKEWTVVDSPVYVTTGTATYDAHGRATTTTDALGAISRAEFTPSRGGPVTGIKTTSPATENLSTGLVTTATLDTATGQPTKIVDPNGQLTETEYDALGRVSKVWLPNRLRQGDPPNPKGSAEFSYLVRRDGPTVITSTKVGPNGVHVSSNTLYDGLLRQRQTQVPSVDMRYLEPNNRPVPVEEGRLIADTRYDSHGRPFKTTQPYFTDAPVDTNLWLAADSAVPGLTRTQFDGTGRAVKSVYQAGAIENKWETRTDYGGDRISVTPPAGSTATTTITDARGQITELRQYKAPTPDGDYESTRYSHTPAGQLKQVTGPDGAMWTFGYDLRGRKTTAQDPDAGTSTMGYDGANRLISTTDARGQTVTSAYDALGRKTQTRDARTNKELARWTYDTAPNGKGLGASSTRLVGTDEYTARVDAYTALGKPSTSSITIPDVEGALKGTYTTGLSYGADGSLTGELYPKTGGLEEETVNYGLDNWGRPYETKTPGTKLVASTLFTRYGEVERLEHGATPSRVWRTFHFDTSTRRPLRSIVDVEKSTPVRSDVHYTHDPAGNITSIADLTTSSPDIQCFRHDHLRRLTEAWTAARTTWSEPTGQSNGGCTADPAVAAGPAPYWHSFRYGPGGNRLEETQRGPAASTTRTYSYPTGQSQPHTLRTITSPTGTETYEYNAAGFTTRRAKSGADETYTWDAEGHLQSVTNKTNNQTTSFIYTPDGSRLLRKDPTGTTLYLGSQELRLNVTGGAPVATRYYTHAGATVAMRQGTKLTWLTGDHQGTAQLAINADDLAVTPRRQLPFGAPRGAALTWPNERGFVGGTIDSSTGLTHLGAREYDPGTGRFISVDPIMNVADPQQMHGYAYSNNNPITFSDPTGLVPIHPDDHYGPGHTPTSPPSPRSPDGGYSGGGNYDNDTGGGRACSGRACGRTDNGDRKKAAPPVAIVAKPSPSAFAGCEVDEGALYLNETICKGSTRLLPPEDAHAVLDVCGTSGIFVLSQICDVTNAFNYAVERDLPGAGVSLLGLIQGLGDIATGSRVAGRTAKGSCSFDGDTEVLMADGTTKPISEIEVGDQVLAVDPETGQRGARYVITVLPHADSVLELATEDGSTVTTTEDHPFYNATDRQWQRADRLDAGDVLHTASGAVVRVKGLQVSTQRVDTAYDLTVAGIHTYFVLIRATPVLVHNCGELAADAARFPGQAHTLTEHVGLTRQKAVALAQLPHKRGRNGVFDDEHIAQAVVDYGLANASRRIHNWLSGSEQSVTIHGTFGRNNSIGWVAHANDTVTRASNSYTIVLRRASGHPGGFYVHSAFPR
jgi:RHS repeat-associated protein